MQIIKKATRLVASKPTKLSNEVRTDQSFKKQCDINNIVKQFHKTGRLPENQKIGQYGDFSQVSTLEASFDVVQNAREAFYSLPSDIRKLLDNDASKLEAFVSDANNYDILLKHGLIEKKPDLTLEEQQARNAAAQADTTTGV